MIIGKFQDSQYDRVYFAECEIDDANIAIIDILAQLEDLSGETLVINDIEFYSAKSLKVTLETKVTFT